MIHKPIFVKQDGLLISILPPSDRYPSKQHVKTLEDTTRLDTDAFTLIVQTWND